MHRSVVMSILVGSLVLLAALIGLLGYRAYQNYYVPMVVASKRSVGKLSMTLGPDLEVQDNLKSTPAGIVAEITLTNKSSQDFTKVSLTDVKYDTFSPSGLPLEIKGLAKGKTKKITLAIPGLKTTSPGYTMVGYSYDWKSGGGSGSYSTGMPPPVSTPVTPMPKNSGFA